VGEAATYYRTSGGVPIPGSGIGNKGFSRVGFTGQFYFGPHFDVNVVTQHGVDNAYFGQGYGNAVNPSLGVIGTPLPNFVPGTVLPASARAPSWNGVTVEARYVYSPQFIMLARYEAERMSQQANPTNASNLGNITNYVIGYRYNPFMTSRAGFAYHGEFNLLHQDGTGPNNSAGNATNINTSELLFGIDFDF